MAVVLDATVGGASANTYVDESEADAYFETFHWFAATWAGFGSTEKAQRLIEAARAIDSLDFVAEKADEDQALEFPRSTQDDTAEIPPEVRKAQMEAALFDWRERDPETGSREPGIKRFEAAGKVEIEFESGGRTPRDGLALLGASEDRIRALLRDWLGAGASANNFAIIR